MLYNIIDAKESFLLVAPISSMKPASALLAIPPILSGLPSVSIPTARLMIKKNALLV
jgi:hypothetical protein